MPPRDQWQPLAVPKARLHVRVPPGVFATKDGADAFELVSSVTASDLGPGSRPRPFAIRLQRFARSADALLGDTTKSSPLGRAYVEGAFPKRTTASFVAQPAEPMSSGAAVKATVAGRPAWVWVTGVEGYDTDYVLVDLGANDSLLVTADWNTAIMMGQPECWQRAVIGGVVESLTLDARE